MEITTSHKLHFTRGWEPERVKQTLLAAQRMVLVAHLHADGDAVGSLTGMATLLKQATHARVTMMLPEGCPDEFNWLPTSEEILSGEDDHQQCLDAIERADLVILLDLNTFTRTGSLSEALEQCTAHRMLVDHHLDPNAEQFQLVVSEPDLSSTCELVYWLMTTTFGSSILTPQAATCLYTGICTDTGTFSYSNDRTSLYLATAGLLRTGIEPADINRRIRNVFTESRLRFFGHAVDNLLTVYPERKIALLTIPHSEMTAYGITSADVSGLINEVMRLRDIEGAILVREEADGLVRLSLRSKTQLDVSQVAHDLFGGGGHARAAGATSTLSLADTVATIKRHLLLFLTPLLCLVAMACNHTPVVDLEPQNKPSLQENLIEANRYIAGIEATQINAYLERRGWQASHLDGGIRVCETSEGNRQPVNYGDTVCVTYTVENIAGQPIYTDRTDTLTVGRLQPTRGLDAALRTLHHRSQAVVILPSEQAFGVVGDGDRIGTRTILVYRLKINN